MGNTLYYTAQVVSRSYSPSKGSTPLAKPIPVQFHLTFHNVDNEELNRILDAVDQKVSYPVKVEVDVS